MFSPRTTPVDRIQGRLLDLAAMFILLYALSVTLTPAVRAHSWEVELPYYHWLGVVTWLAVFTLAHRWSARRLPERDPYLLPACGLLSGWGLMTIARLSPGLGLRQTAWLAAALATLVLGLKVPDDLRFLRRYKYLWLTSGLLLTALTLVFGTNPLGYGPRLWLGCCGIYFQPSEPLKLLLVVYLSAYLADRLAFLQFGTTRGESPTRPPRQVLLPLLAPTVIMTGLALLLLLVQRDLGTASVFLFLYAAVVYNATRDLRVVAVSAITLLVAGQAGYTLFDVVRLRMDAWLNPWLDPSGRSFQIIQSLLAIANGGLFGRGPGLGSPGLVPVAHSDFIFASIAEETGLVGIAGLLLLVGLIASRGYRAALKAPDSFRRLLAAGLIAHLAGQSILIIGGNMRLMPLTGVTLPFVSYGGSSLLTSYLSLLLLLKISSQTRTRPLSQPGHRPYVEIAAVISTGLVAASLVAGWWAIYRAPVLLTRTDNARRVIDDRYVRRGSLLDRHNQPLVETTGRPGTYVRHSLYPPLGPVLGYTHPIYGQANLEASLDPFLRGLKGYPDQIIRWNYLLYGQPPPGLDVRLSLDLELQRRADGFLEGHKGALVLLNAENGDILIMASHPYCDPNRLDETWPELIDDPNAPLLNRSTQGLYPIGPALGPLLLGTALNEGSLPDLNMELSFREAGHSLDCALPVSVQARVDTWGTAIAAGCPGPVASLGQILGEETLLHLFEQTGMDSSPQVLMPAASSQLPETLEDARLAALGIAVPEAPEQALHLSPLQMALAISVISSGGNQPALRLAQAVHSAQGGWTSLPPQGFPRQVLPAAAANTAAQILTSPGLPLWQSVAVVASSGSEPNQEYTWYLGGTLPGWQGSPLVTAILLEENDPDYAQKVGQAILKAAINP